MYLFENVCYLGEGLQTHAGLCEGWEGMGGGRRLTTMGWWVGRSGPRCVVPCCQITVAACLGIAGCQCQVNSELSPSLFRPWNMFISIPALLTSAHPLDVPFQVRKLCLNTLLSPTKSGCPFSGLPWPLAIPQQSRLTCLYCEVPGREPRVAHYLGTIQPRAWHSVGRSICTG